MTDAEPLMRVTSIDLDDAEMPETVAVVMSWAVWDRLCRDGRALRSVARQDARNPDLWSDRFPVQWVAKTAHIYWAPADAVTQEIRSCLASLCNRFWEGGVREAVRELGVEP